MRVGRKSAVRWSARRRDRHSDARRQIHTKRELQISRALHRYGAVGAKHGQWRKIERQVAITLEGADREQLGQVAAQIRELRPPEPYKGKGIKYAEEKIRRKAGKTAAGAGR